MGSELLTIEGLRVIYPKARRPALDGVDLRLAAGETVGVVGESGSGKSTLGNAVIGLVPVAAGVIRLNGEEITRAPRARRRALARELQAVFQDPYSSLNPARTVGQAIAEGLTQHQGLSREEIAARVEDVLVETGLPANCVDRFPSQLSGGQRQRVAIARAVIGQPKVIVCDEVTSALDLSVQAQILNLLQHLQTRIGLSLVFIGHDLPVVRHVAHRITVLYQGHVVEEGPADAVYEDPQHPYTRMLLAASPVPDPRAQLARRRVRLDAAHERPGQAHLPVATVGCPFVSRCGHAVADCRTTSPQRTTYGVGHSVACLRLGELDPVPD